MVLGGIRVLLPPERRWKKASVYDFLLTQGFSAVETEQLLADLHLDIKLKYENLPLTPRLLVDLRAALSSGAQLIVFTSAGLDPLGIEQVTASVSDMLGPCSAIEVVSRQSLGDYSDLSMYTQIVRCDQAPPPSPGTRPTGC